MRHGKGCLHGFLQAWVPKDPKRGLASDVRPKKASKSVVSLTNEAMSDGTKGERRKTNNVRQKVEI